MNDNISEYIKKEMRKETIYKIAVSRYIEENNFNVFDYLTKEERLEYERLQYQLGESEYNPDE